jgi:hypothetical protein
LLVYAPENWRALLREDGPDQFIEAIQRHTLKIRMGEVVDADTGRTHAGAIAVNAAMLSWFYTATQAEKDSWLHVSSNPKIQRAGDQFDEPAEVPRQKVWLKLPGTNPVQVVVLTVGSEEIEVLMPDGTYRWVAPSCLSL